MKIDGNELAIEQNELDREGPPCGSHGHQAGISEAGAGERVTTAPASRPALTTATALSA